jgi:cation diffusion facilitator family transporter
MAATTPTLVSPHRSEARREVKRALLIALGVNVGMSVLKLAVGLKSGSLALLADAMHSATDGLSSLLGLITNGLSDPKPDRDHPYGHDKYEAVGALAIAGFILFTAVELLRTAVRRIATGLQPLRLDGHDLLVLLIVLGCNLLLAAYERSEGKRLNSPLLLADARHTSGDLWTTVLVLLGLSAVLVLQQTWLDVAMAMPLCLLLFRSCWRVLRANLPWLVDQIAIAPEAIHEVAMAVPGVLNVHDIASRGVLGQRVFIELHMVVDADDLPTAHRITELVEEHLQAKFGEVRCTIHLEPREYAIPTITFRGAHG